MPFYEKEQRALIKLNRIKKLDIALDKNYQLVTTALFQKITDESVILEADTGIYFTLDALGTFIVENLKQNKTVANIVQAITDNYDVDQLTAQDDLLNLLNDMHDKGLIIEK